MPLAVGVPLMVTVLVAHTPVTPAGRPANVAPVAVVVVYLMLVMAALIHGVWAFVPTAEVSVTVLFGTTLIVPVLVIAPQPPLNVTVYVLLPLAVGVPLIVTVLVAQLPVTPAGSPPNVAPVAPVVV